MQIILGYKWVDNVLQIDEKEAPLRKLIYELYAKEKRKKTVARILTERGYRTKTGNNFSAQTITQIIQDPVSKGLRRTNYTTSQNGKLVKKPIEEWIFVKAPAIVTEDLWQLCNNIMDSHTKRRQPAKRVTHLFSSHIKCDCGGKMYVRSNSPKYVCQTCRNKISKKDMEEIFHEQLRDFLFSQEEVKEYLTKAKQVLLDKKHQLDALRKNESELHTELNNIIRLNTKSVLSDENFPAHYNPLSERLKQLQTRIAELQGELVAISSQLNDSEYTLNEAKDLYSRWKELAFEDKRTIVELIVKEIIVGKEDIDIILLYSPSSSPAGHPLLTGGKKGKYPDKL